MNINDASDPRVDHMKGGSININSSSIATLFGKDKDVKLRDTYGGPTLMQYVSERVLEEQSHVQL